MKTLWLIAAAAIAQTAEPPKYPQMTLIPAGEFAMGDHHNFVDPGHPSDEIPIHTVRIDAFLLGVYDVTNAQYVEYLNAAYALGLIEVRGGMVYGKASADAYCETRQMSDYSSIAWDGRTFAVADFRANHPVVGVRWAGAAAYTNWLSLAQGLEACYDLATGKCDFTRSGYRLPTEAEWEYAARGGLLNPYRKFPWGDDADYTKANWPDSKDPYESGPYPWTTPVGFYPPNGFGLYDMSGNVWQWCHDWYGRDYYRISPNRNPTGPEKGDPMPDGLPYRVMRGGNWYNGDATDPGHGRVSNRDPGYFRGPQDPNHPYYHVGFRVARAAPSLTTRSAASFAEAVAPASIASAFGSGLEGGAVAVTDAAGVERPAQVLASAAVQINFVVPEGTRPGQATVAVRSGGSVVAFGGMLVEAAAPGLFSASGDGTGVAAGVALRVAADGSQTSALLFEPSPARRSVAVDLGAAGDQVYLLLFGTGMRGAAGAGATIGGTAVGLSGPVAQPQFAGLDQVNLGPLPRSLAGRGEVAIVLMVDGRAANQVTVNVR